MKTQKKTLHRHTHPIHWHGSMILAISALLLTSFKCSDQMLRALRAVPVHAITFESVENVHMRDVETSHSAIILNAGIRHAVYSGK